MAYPSVHGLEAHGALDETVDAQLVIQSRVEMREKINIAWPGSLCAKSRNCLRQVHLEGHSVLRVVEHKAPR